MTKKELVKSIASLEGKRHQASVGDIREILTIIEQIDKNTDGEAVACIQRGASKKKVKKSKLAL